MLLLLLLTWLMVLVACFSEAAPPGISVATPSPVDASHGESKVELEEFFETDVNHLPHVKKFFSKIDDEPFRHTLLRVSDTDWLTAGENPSASATSGISVDVFSTYLDAMTTLVQHGLSELLQSSQFKPSAVLETQTSISSEIMKDPAFVKYLIGEVATSPASDDVLLQQFAKAWNIERPGENVVVHEHSNMRFQLFCFKIWAYIYRAQSSVVEGLGKIDRKDLERVEMSVKELISTKLADLAKQDPSVHRGVCLFFDWQQAGALPFDSGAGNEYRSLVEINAMIWIWRVQRFVQQKITSMISSFKPTSLPKQPTDSDEGPDLTRDELLVKYYRWIQKNRNVEQFSEYFRVMEDFLVVLQEQLFEDANQRGQHESNGNPWAASITESDQGTEALSLRLDRLLFRARENRKQLFQYMVLRFSETRLVPVDREQAKFKGEHHTEILVAPKSEHSSLMANVDKVFKGLKFPAAQREAIEVLLPF